MSRRHAAVRALAVTAAALAVAVAPAGALGAACPRTSVAEIENEVMCPVCKTPLGLAQEAPQADRERAFILERVEQCQSKAEIKAALAAEFGDEVLAMPEDEGFDLAAYLVPLLGVVGGLGACALAVVRWRGRRASAPLPPGSSEVSGHPSTGDPKLEPDAAARLERDLDRYDL
ncbi:MAG TPA: cytochrome c-type biogenesis protein CcmH [Thermoleophilaceae bacterium]|nr:cytochrome c-type biogenesis protein CcmH [Thermoleophilaceae bacterium]